MKLTLSQLASENSLALGTVLRRANFARTTNFDLIGDDGFTLLQAELAADFPCLTLAETNAIIMRGVKGELDKYKSLPLNFPRIYQWIKMEAHKQPSAWWAKYPEAMGWADLTGIAAQLLALLAADPAQGANLSLVLTNIRRLIGFSTTTREWSNLATHGPLADVLDTFWRSYPVFAEKHQNFLG